MKKFSTLFLVAAVALVGMFAGAKKAEAIPAFARQVGVPCYSCHYQHIPKLNAFGREFKLGGMTQTAQDLIQDEGLSIPPVLNAAILFKYRFQIQGPSDKAATGAPTKNGQKYGEWALPDESSLFFAGRVAENIGGFTEVPIGGARPNSKFVFSKDFDGTRGGVSIYNTSGAGSGFSMELFNTGATPTQRATEDRSHNAMMAIGGPSAEGPAEGISFFAGNSLFFANLGLTAASNQNLDAGLNFAYYYRVALTPKIADGMDVMVGVQGAMGKAKAWVGKDMELEHNSMAVDAQLQTEVGGNKLEVIAAYHTVGTTGAITATANTVSAYNSDWDGTAPCVGAGGAATCTNGVDTKKAFSVSADYSLSNHTGVKAGYGNITPSSKSYNAILLGGWWAVAQNIDLSLEYVMYSGDAREHDNRLIVLLEWAY